MMQHAKRSLDMALIGIIVVAVILMVVLAR